jgi:hypothetical protein
MRENIKTGLHQYGTAWTAFLWLWKEYNGGGLL